MVIDRILLLNTNKIEWLVTGNKCALFLLHKSRNTFLLIIKLRGTFLVELGITGFMFWGVRGVEFSMHMLFLNIDLKIPFDMSRKFRGWHATRKSYAETIKLKRKKKNKIKRNKPTS